MALPVLVHALEQLVARQLLALPDDPGQPSIRDIDDVPLSALAAELEAEARPLDRDVPVPQGRQAERAVLLRILDVPDPDQRGLEEAHDRGEDLLPG